MNHPIRSARLAAGKSQVEIAEALGVTQQTVSMWETGTTSPSARRLAALASELGTTVDELLAA